MLLSFYICFVPKEKHLTRWMLFWFSNFREPFKWCPGHDVLVMGTDVLVREIHAYYDALERESQTDTNVLQSNNPRLFILEFNHALLYSTTTTRHRWACSPLSKHSAVCLQRAPISMWKRFYRCKGQPVYSTLISSSALWWPFLSPCTVMKLKWLMMAE